MLLDQHTDFSGGRSGGLVFPSLYEFSTVCCDSYVVSTNHRVLIYCTCHFQGGSLCFSFFCLLVSSVSDFCPDTRGQWWTLFIGSLVQSCCWEGGTLQTNNTGVCSQCLSHTGPAPAHGACALPAHTAQALGCSLGTVRGRPWAACTSQV